jgi:hypothetical protein
MKSAAPFERRARPLPRYQPIPATVLPVAGLITRNRDIEASSVWARVPERKA